MWAADVCVVRRLSAGKREGGREGGREGDTWRTLPLPLPHLTQWAACMRTLLTSRTCAHLVDAFSALAYSVDNVCLCVSLVASWLALDAVLGLGRRLRQRAASGRKTRTAPAAGSGSHRQQLQETSSGSTISTTSSNSSNSSNSSSASSSNKQFAVPLPRYGSARLAASVLWLQGVPQPACGSEPRDHAGQGSESSGADPGRSRSPSPPIPFCFIPSHSSFDTHTHTHTPTHTHTSTHTHTHQQ